ncbi:MAG TPA: MerR family transcriptional regulator [Dongiaceae bacterium]|nr:MerR family transcriptional regulator [Dongiaceae bacterium]
MRIGQLSKEAGVQIGAIRFYERRKILRSPSRSSSGYRAYTCQDVEILRGIKQLQELGFTLREIKELIDLHRSVASVSTHRQRPEGLQRMIDLTKEKIDLFEKKSLALCRMQKDLSKMLESLLTSAQTACPVARQMANAKACPKA